MDVTQLLLFKELGIGLFTFIVIWAVMALPTKIGIQKTVGKGTYRRILKEYKEMKFHKIFGSFFIIMGVIGFWMVYSSVFELTVIEDFKQNQIVFVVPVLLICFGIYCRFLGFVKAMGNLM